MLQSEVKFVCYKVIGLIEKFLTSKSGKEVLFYIIAGVATTAVNWVAYLIFKIFCTPTVSNIIAWAVSVVFAYGVNSRWVFETNPESMGAKMRQLAEFTLARVTSGVIESVCIFVFVEILMFNDIVIKLIMSVFVIVFNYLVSKLWIFSKRRNKKESV